MVFSSLVFLFAYLPLTLLIYYVTPRKWRNLFLFFINLLFGFLNKGEYIAHTENALCHSVGVEYFQII